MKSLLISVMLLHYAYVLRIRLNLANSNKNVPSNMDLFVGDPNLK